jgi:hypothetical protein
MTTILLVLIPAVVGLTVGLGVLWLAEVLAARGRKMTGVRRIREL